MWKVLRIFDYSFDFFSMDINVKAKIRTYIIYFLICFFTSLTNHAFAQLFVPNPSFEDKPVDATTPVGWYPCEPYTTPDIFPGYWGVYNDPSDGNSFIGLITRQDGSFESIAARLNQALTAKECYRMKIDLAHSKTYAGYNKPLSIKIWVGTKKCRKGQMIYHSEEIKHSEWKTYNIEFIPTKESQYILIEAFYKEGRFSHKGNILLDNMSSIILCKRA